MNFEALQQRFAAIQEDPIAVLALSVHGVLLATTLLSALTAAHKPSWGVRAVRGVWLVGSALLAMRAAYLVMKRFEFFMQTRVVLGLNEVDAELLRQSSLYYHIAVLIVLLANVTATLCGRVRLCGELVGGALHGAALLALCESMYLFTQVVETTLHEVYLLAPLTLYVAFQALKLLGLFVCTSGQQQQQQKAKSE